MKNPAELPKNTPYCYQKALQSGFMNRKPLAALVVSGFLAISGIATGTTSAAPLVPALPLSPASQANAVSKAEDYLSYTAFSRQGLIDQLKFDQFSTEDATY